MLSAQQARKLELALPEAVEQDHHGRPSFRGDVCEEVWWGQRLAAVRVALPRADRRLVRELLQEAWERKAPGRLTRNRGSDERA